MSCKFPNVHVCMTGSENSFEIMARVETVMRRARIAPAEFEAYRQAAMAGSRHNLVRVTCETVQRLRATLRSLTKRGRKAALTAPASWHQQHGVKQMPISSIASPRPAGNGAGWNSARVDLLKTLWADGLPANQIAAKLGEVTRNAVIGKAHRLGLPGRKTTSRTPRPRRTSPLRNRTMVLRSRPCPATPDRLPAVPTALMLSVAGLTGSTCHWPIGDPRSAEFGFCGSQTASGRQPYCAHHQAAGHNRGHA